MVSTRVRTPTPTSPSESMRLAKKPVRPLNWAPVEEVVMVSALERT